MQKKMVHKIVIAAYVREIRQMKTRFKLDKFTITNAVGKTRLLLQGDPLAPKAYNQAFDLPAAEFLEKADQEDWGIMLREGSEKHKGTGFNPNRVATRTISG